MELRPKAMLRLIQTADKDGVSWISWTGPAGRGWGVSENSENPFSPNGFADHYPVFKWLFVWGYTLFSDKPILCIIYYVQLWPWLPVITGDLTMG